jgi:hypothetical protein
MSAYTHPLAFTVRPKDTAGVELRTAPEIDSDGRFRPSPMETVLCEFENASISFSRKKVIEIPQDASPRKRARLEKKIEKQHWEHLGTLKKARFVATSFRLLWIAKHKGEVWVGFTPKGLLKAAARTAASSVMAAGKWDIGQVLLTMVGGAGADGDKRLVFTFADSETKFRIDVEKIRGARDSLPRIHQRAVSLIRRVYEQYSPHQTEAIEALRSHEARQEPTRHKGSFVSYSAPYVCVAPLLPDEQGSVPTSSAPQARVDPQPPPPTAPRPAADGRSARASRRIEKKQRAASRARRFRRWIKILSPPVVMAVAVVRWMSSVGMSGRSAEYMATSTLCLVALGVLTGLVISWVLSGIRIRRGGLALVGYGVLGFAAWQEWGDPWYAPLQLTYELSSQVQSAPFHVAYVLQYFPSLAFSLFVMAMAWGLLMRGGD